MLFKFQQIFNLLPSFDLLGKLIEGFYSNAIAADNLRECLYFLWSLLLTIFRTDGPVVQINRYFLLVLI